MNKTNELRMIAKHMAIEYRDADIEDYISAITENLDRLNKLNKTQRIVLKLCYMFSRKVDRQEREDCFQELYLKALIAIKQDGVNDAKLLYAIVRRDWKDYLGKLVTNRHLSINTQVSDDAGHEVEFGDLLVGECEFELKHDSELDANSIYNALPAFIKTIVDKRLQGKSAKSGGGDSKAVQNWLKTNKANSKLIRAWANSHGLSVGRVTKKQVVWEWTKANPMILQHQD